MNESVLYHIEMLRAVEDIKYSHLTEKERKADIKPVRNSRTNPKIGRNDLCYCGSGKKFKKCCGKLTYG